MQVPNINSLHKTYMVTVPVRPSKFKNFYFGIVFTKNIDNLQEGTMGS
jgi:hypothetical protein